MFHIFVAVEHDTLKFPKITYFVAFDNVITRDVAKKNLCWLRKSFSRLGTESLGNRRRLRLLRRHSRRWGRVWEGVAPCHWGVGTGGLPREIVKNWGKFGALWCNLDLFYFPKIATRNSFTEVKITRVTVANMYHNLSYITERRFNIWCKLHVQKYWHDITI